MPALKKLYAQIEKTEELDDGTVKVFGWASTGAQDSDGETVTPECMKAALPDYMKFGAVREMHDAKKAAGTAIEAEVRDDGRTWFGAHVVDSEAVKKVQAGVYKGFSIGGRVTARDTVNKSVIKGINLIEVSLVDRPANPEAVITMFKADDLGADDAAGGDADDTKTAAAGADDLQKGAWNAKNLIDALAALSQVKNSAEWEATYGEHSKEMCDALMAAVKVVGDVAQQYLSEEVQLMTRPSTAGAQVKAAADEGGDLAKAGKRFSAATKAALKSAHEACKMADKALADLGYDDDHGEDEENHEVSDGMKAAQADDLAKAAQARADEVTALAKAAGIEIAEPTADALLKGAVAELLKARAEVKRLNAEPAAPKGAVRAVPVSKAADGGGQDEPPPVVKATGEVDEVATLVKAAHARPIRLA